jgi:hypothetical protein
MKSMRLIYIIWILTSNPTIKFFFYSDDKNSKQRDFSQFFTPQKWNNLLFFSVSHLGKDTTHRKGKKCTRMNILFLFFSFLTDRNRRNISLSLLPLVPFISAFRLQLFFFILFFLFFLFFFQEIYNLENRVCCLDFFSYVAQKRHSNSSYSSYSSSLLYWILVAGIEEFFWINKFFFLTSYYHNFTFFFLSQKEHFISAFLGSWTRRIKTLVRKIKTF